MENKINNAQDKFTMTLMAVITFVILKTTGIIAWSWWWVVLILTIDLLIVLLVVLLAFLVGIPFALVGIYRYFRALLS